LKTLFDYIIASLTLILFSPLLLLVALAIKIDSKGTVFYLQTRIGKDGKPFRIIKFRTMSSKTGGNLTYGYTDPRITRIGRIIRKIHMDEFAQLINVLKGDMSLVGPRPETPEFTKFHPKLWKTILKCKPGITGLAALKCSEYEYKILEQAGPAMANQVYINQILLKKLRYEVFYVTKRNFCLDMLVIFWTIKKLFITIYS
jgi:lipopolysaccharide/colanic/teichoic acid biosynthesis glycosyltransferase